MLNRRITADEAVSLGMITRVVDDAALNAEVADVAGRLAVSATAALGKVRTLLLASFGASLETQMEAEARAISELSRTPHGREGIAAFGAKRKPNFS